MLFNKLFILILGLLFVLSCGSSKGQQETLPETTTYYEQRPAENIQVEGLWGKIDNSIAEETFQSHFNAFIECYQYEALETLEEIEGTLSVYLIVDKDGRVTDDIFFEDGDFGCNATQKCFLDKIGRIRFQKPIGGYQARVRYTFPLQEPYGHPKPFDWSGEKIEKVIEQNASDVEECIGGRTGIKLTLYVGYKGKVVAAGCTAENVEDYIAGECLAEAALNWVFPQDPGRKRPAKASIEF